ncbi:MAG: BNR-4 repeat-containing protein [Clostridia bacterium]|nr:BNR-4 repeat-containing protein [Clostridia bacterium]
MLNTDLAKERRIKRANTDWWIHSKAIVADNGMTYIGYYTDTGEIHIKEMDAKCSRTPSRDFRLCTLNCTYADEHNAPSVCVLKSGRILVAYTGHQVKAVKYRFTEKPYDISSFVAERELPYDGTATYVQIYENTVKNELWMFSRVDGYKWVFRYSKDEGETWSPARTFLNSDPGNAFDSYLKDKNIYIKKLGETKSLFYFDIRKQHILTKKGSDEQFLFALYGHPYKSMDHTIRSGIFDSRGYLLKNDGTRCRLNLYEDRGDVLDFNSLDVVYTPPEGCTSRLLEVSSTLPLRIGFASFEMDVVNSPDPQKPTYYSATFRNGAWQISKPICKAGEFLAKDIYDGSQTYLGGMAYYYGVGESGFEPEFINRTFVDTNRIFIARFDGQDRVLESYVTHNFGETYEKEQVIRRIPGDRGVKIWRPTVPIHAQDNMPVYWHEGTYTAHTGGWHCDVVMLVEYDD